MKILKQLVKFVVAVSLLAAAKSYADGILDANTATEAELAALPHMNAARATAVVENRPFATIGDLNALLSAELEESQLDELYGAVFVRIDLNSAAESDILLIPGVGGRMAHEFEEYRPYTSMEQFRREIGKYVDEEEVARLEQYVRLDLD